MIFCKLLRLSPSHCVNQLSICWMYLIFVCKLLIDEVDQLYRIYGNLFPAVVTTFNDLSYFANQPSGRIYITLCGLTTFMEDLITNLEQR
jgi:hypothetical protein